MPPSPPLDIRRLTPADAPALAAFFAEIAADPASARFHPHAFDAVQAERVAGWSGRDVYLAAFDGPTVVGYGMLRGWDDGWQVPSLGICLAPSSRGRGLSRPLMLALHEHARAAGAPRIRLKVYPDNTAAVRLYESLGYVFASEEAGQRVGLLELPPQRHA